MVAKQTGSDLSSERKKRKRVGFDNINVGIEANECIKIFLVNSPKEVDAADSFCIEPIDLNHFFGKDGKIFGYRDLQVRIWLSTVSFHAYADITFERKFNGSKGITDLHSALQNIFGESLVEKKEEFLHTFSTEGNYIRNVMSNGVTVHCEASEGHEDTKCNQSEAEEPAVQVIRMNLRSMPVAELYSRLVPLVLLLVDGGSPVDITDPKWEIFFVVERSSIQSGYINFKLLGFATVYCFFHYPDSSRLRISQILVLPPYQGQGYGRLLLETLNSIAVSENVYDVTAEEPSDYLQHVRACIDTLRLLSFEPLKPALASVTSQLKESNLSKRTCKFHSNPPAGVIEEVRKLLKINKKQFLLCWEVLIYLNLDSEDSRLMENYRACISDKLRADILGKDVGNSGKRVFDVPNDCEPDKTFIMFRCWTDGAATGMEGEGEENQKIQEEQLSQVVDERMEEIVNVAKKVSLHGKS